MRTPRLAACIIALSTVTGAAHSAQVLLYCAYDGSTDAAYSAVGATAGSGASNDVLMLRKQVRFDDGKVGQARDFAVGGVGYIAQENFNQSRGTLSLWVKPTWEGANTTDYCTFFGVPKWGLLSKYTDQTIITFGWIKEDGHYDYGCTAPIDHWKAGEWHHIAISWSVDQKRRRLYFDGELAREGLIPSTHPAEEPLTIGSSPGYINPSRALIDEVYVWDDELPPEEIAAAHERTLRGEPSWPTPAAPAAAAGTAAPPERVGRPPLPEQVDWDLTHAERITTATRDRISLNGYWRFQPLPGPSAEPSSEWAYLRVPGNWSGQEFSVWSQDWTPIATWQGDSIRGARLAWYEREFVPPASWRGRRVTLGIDSVRAVGEVYLNGEGLGRALEYQRWSAEVSPHLRLGESNLLQIHVRTLNFQANARGVDQDVWLEAGPSEGQPCVEATLLRTSVRDKRLEAHVRLTSPALSEFEGKLVLSVADGEGREVLSGASPATSRDVTVSIPWRDPRCWSPEDPYLYSATVRVIAKSGEVIDEAFPIRFGFRELEIRGGDFYLNGVKTHLKGQAAPPFQQYPFCASEEIIREWFRQLKSVGCHAVREYTGRWRSGYSCVWRDLYYDIADEMGIIIFAHVPDADPFIHDLDDPEIAAGLRERIAAFVERYGNHPCLAMWFQHFNTGSHVNDINPAWLDGSFDPATADPALQASIRLGLPERHRAMRWAEEALREADCRRRPIFHHAAGNFGEALTVMAYLNFDIPLQEREEWPSAWAAGKPKPLMPVETGFPCILSWYKGRANITGLHDVYGSEPLFTEYAAAYLGDEAYANVTAEEVEAMGGPDGRPDLEAMKLTSANYDSLKYLFGEWTVRSWRALDLSGYCQHVEYRDCFRYETSEEPLALPGPLEFGLGLDNPPAGVRRATQLTRLGHAMQRANMPILAFIGGEPTGDAATTSPLSPGYSTDSEGVTGKEHAFFSGEEVRKSIVLVNDTMTPRKMKAVWRLLDDGKELIRKSVKARVAPGEVKLLPIRFRAPQVTGVRKRLALELTAEANDWPELPPDRLGIEIWPVRAPLDLSDARIVTLNLPGWSWLRDSGADVVRLDDGDMDVDDAQLVIIGEDTDPSALADLEKAGLWDAVAEGTHVLVLAQHRSAIAGLPTSYRRTRRCFVRAAGHPLLTGLSDEDLFHWRGKPEPAVRLARQAHEERDPGRWPDEFWPWSAQGIVATHVIDKPQAGSFVTLVDCEFDHLYAALLERRWGRGTVFLCQLNVQDRYGLDPVATLLVRRLVGRLTGTELTEPAAARTLTSDAASLLDELGFAHGPAASVSDLDDSALAITSAPSPGLVEFCVRGGLAVLIGDPGAGIEGLEVEPETVHRVLLEDVPSDWEGIGPSDLFFKWPREVSVVHPASGWSSNPGVLAKVGLGKGTLYICTVRPADFDLAGDALRRAKLRRVISTLLAGLGVSARAHLPLAAEEPATGPGTPCPEPALDYNPYLYRRW